MLDIESILPHRPPFLFIDEVVEINNNRIVAKRKISPQEYYFKGHYPGNPVMPGVLTCETMFQAGALLMAEMLDKKTNGVPVVTRVNNVKLKKMLKPGDTMIIEVVFIEKMANAYMFKGKVRSGNEVAASCEFTCTIVSEA